MKYIMNNDPDLYDHANSFPKRDAFKLLDRLASDYKDREVGLMVDIGCGSGNVTKRLSQLINYKSAMASDLSKEMVLHTAKVHQLPNFQYADADISADWSVVKQQMGLNENSVDLIFSNHAIHWIENLPNVIKNVQKLLKPGGMAYLNWIHSWTTFIPVNQKFAMENGWGKYLCDDKGLVDVNKCGWQTPDRHPSNLLPDVAKQVGLNVVDFQIIDTAFNYDTFEAFKNNVIAICPLLPRIPDGRKEEFLQEYFDYIKREYVPNHKFGKNGVSYKYKCATLILSKPNNCNGKSN